MDERRQPHVTCYQRACLTVLPGDRAIAVRAIQLSGCRLRIVLGQSLALNAPVSIEVGDWLGLGEVCSCRAEYSHYVSELQLDQMLIGLRDFLGRLALWLNRAPQPPSFVVHVTEQPLA